MAKRGSITLFLALMLSILMSLVCAGIESVRMASARAQILSSLDIGLYSLFGQYDKQLFEKYSLLFLDGSCGRNELNMAQVYDNMETYIKPVLMQNSQILLLEQGGFAGYRLATDEGGEVFYHQVVQYMKDTLGSQGAQLLLARMRDRKEETRRAEERGQQAEQGNSMSNYESEMSEASRNSQAEQERRKEQGIVDQSFASAQPAVNPISVIKRIRRMGILELVLPLNRGVSDGSTEKKTLISGRKLERGMPMIPSVKTDNSYTSQVLFQQYLLDKLGNYQRPGEGSLRYQIEYVINGKDGDLANLKATANKLLLIREGVNLAHLVSDSQKRLQAEILSLSIASGFLVPPAAAVIEGALLLCWSFGESVLDVRELFHGGKVPLVKKASDWQLSLENLPNLLESLDSSRRGTSDGMSYEDYLQILLLSLNKAVKLYRGMDMIELAVRAATGRQSFRLDLCIEAAEAFVKVRANRKKELTAVRQYCYD